MANTSLRGAVGPVSADSMNLPRGPFFLHGIWALGMRLMRNLTFGRKAGLIVCVFLVPLLTLGYFFGRLLQEQIDFSQSERVGVRALRGYVPVLHGLVQARSAVRAGTGSFDTEAATKAAFARVDLALAAYETELQASHDPLQLLPDLLVLKTAWSQAVKADGGQDDKGRSVFEVLAQANTELLQAIGEHSNLVLDPEIDSYYLMSALALTLPQVADDIGQLWGWSSFAASKGTLKPREHVQFAIWYSGAHNGLVQAKAHIERAIRANPSLRSSLSLSGLDAALAYSQTVSDSSEVISGREAKDLFPAGEGALKALLSVYETGLPVLDHLLDVRIEALTAKRNAMIWIALLSVLVALYLFFAFYLVTRDGLRLISLHLREMADGDLRHTPSLPLGQDEPARVLNDLRKAYDALHRLIHAVDRSVQELQDTALDISGSSQSLAQRTEQAVASLEQQSATMDHIGSTAGHSAELIQHASIMAQGNAQVSNQGGAAINKVVQVMQGINLSSRKIADIIGTIDGITFQTNILALNAAVEAARAGESGRGFAVVASEVRALAQRSATAAREINDLISDSVRQVELGSDVVRHAGATMKEILENASQIEKVLDQVLVGAREQAVAVKQVGQAIQLLDVDTQHNASMVEQTTATALRLKAHADELMVEMGSFRL